MRSSDPIALRQSAKEAAHCSSLALKLKCTPTAVQFLADAVGSHRVGLNHP
ncbi:MAG: hypothetical protein ACPL7R_03585 [Anaerolineae bacterium]